MTDQPQHDHPAPLGYPPQPAPGAGYPYAAPPVPVAPEPWGPLASWGARVGASLIDSLLSLIGLVPYVVGLVLFVVGAPDSGGYDSSGYSDVEADPGNTGLMVTGGVLIAVGILLMLGIQLWNRVFRMGRTGQSIGKRVMGLKLVEERTGQPMGAGMCFVRELAHVLDGAVYIGYLWPLWDDKRRTFADMVMTTLVVRAPKS